MSKEFLDAALLYNSEGLCVIPVKPRDKAVALPTWDEYHTRMSTVEEINRWFGNGHAYNIGIVHGVNNYITIDIDHDRGILECFRQKYPGLFTGRIEQSGSGEGYHVPLFLDDLPYLGWDNGKQRPKGNRTWKTDKGAVNIRARWCQSVVPPSVHPSGGIYKFIQAGPVARISDLNQVIAWLNSIDPSAHIASRNPVQPVRNGQDNSIKDYYPSVLEVFASFGFTDKQAESNGETRILNQGGLVVTEDDQRWYCFSDETGGDVIDAFGWCRFGASWDRYNKQQFRAVMMEMKERVGIDETRIEARITTRKIYHGFGAGLQKDYWND